MFKVFNLITLFLFLAEVGQAQFSTGLGIGSSYDDNLFRSPAPETEILSNLDLQLAYQFSNINLQLNYQGDFNFYSKNNDLNLSLHQLGISYNNAFGDDEAHLFFLGTEGGSRINGSQYEYYDYNQFYLYSNFLFNLDYLYLRTGYNYRYRNYSNLPDLTNSIHTAFIQFNKSFASKTTAIIETDYAIKSFKENGSIIIVNQDTEQEGGKGHGKGPGWSRPSTTASITDYSQTSYLNHIVLLGRIAQSLHQNIGIYLQYRKQISLSDNTNYLNSGFYYNDEEIFDDPFSYGSDQYKSQLTFIMPWAAKLVVAGSYDRKAYITEQAYLSADDTLAAGGDRNDKQTVLSLNLSKKFAVNKKWLRFIDIDIHYAYIHNRSNSYWYDYRNSTAGLNIQWNF